MKMRISKKSGWIVLCCMMVTWLLACKDDVIYPDADIFDSLNLFLEPM